VVAGANTGLSVPVLNDSPARFATLDGNLVTVIVQVFVVVPSCAVTSIVMVLLPTASAIGALALPDVTDVPFTFTVAVESVTVGVTVIEFVTFVTFAV
jgi:hypothetical protein